MKMVHTPIEDVVNEWTMPDDQNNGDTTCNNYVPSNSSAECCGQMESKETVQSIANIETSTVGHLTNELNQDNRYGSFGTPSTPSLTRAPSRISGRKVASCSGCTSGLLAQTNTPSRKRSFQCDVCERSYKSRQNLKRHSSNHKEPSYTCNICSKKFSRKDLCTLHSRTHLTKPFHCDICNMGFKTKRIIKNHIRSHATT